MCPLLHRLVAVSALLLNAALLAPDSRASPVNGPAPNSPEAILFIAANRDRATAGLPPFQWDADLADAAGQHAQAMAQRNKLSHQFPGEPAMQDRARRAGARFSMIAENVAEGPNAATLHTQWMNSAPHRANLLDHELNSIGIAVMSRGNVYFAVEDFSVGVAQKSLSQQEAEVRAELSGYGLQVLRDSADSRKTCAMDRGWAGARPGVVLRYEMGDLSQLPEEVAQKARSG